MKEGVNIGSINPDLWNRNRRFRANNRFNASQHFVKVQRVGDNIAILIVDTGTIKMCFGAYTMWASFLAENMIAFDRCAFGRPAGDRRRGFFR